MRLLGSKRTRKEAEKECLRYVRESPPSEFWDKPGTPTCVIEKAKCRDYPSPKRYVCYRAWVDLDDTSGRLIDIKEWEKEHPVIPGTGRRASKKWSKRGGSPGLDIRNAEQLEEIIMRADFKMNAYARAYFNAIREAQDTAYMFGGASPIKGLKVQALYFLTNVKAMTPEQKETKKALLKWAQSR